jgi:hypothetical protein
MKKHFLVATIAIAITLVSVFSCKKSATTETDYTGDFTVQTQDQTFFSSEDDAVSSDANTLLATDSIFSGRVNNVICDATVERSITATTKVLTITYNGENCDGKRTRTGVVILTLPREKRWRDAGAQLSITYQNLKITRTADKQSIVLNGTETITNTTGGDLVSLATLKTITYSITSTGLSVTFNDGTKQEWEIAKRRVIAYNNGLVISTSGTHTDGAVSNISEWGTTRFGKKISVQIAEPLVIRQDCNFRLVSGKINYLNLEKPVTVTFGLNANGNPTTCPGTGFYYCKVEWPGLQNVSHSIILPY